MKVAFIKLCRGEHTAGPHAVLPRSLMRFAVRLNGLADAAWTMACTMKKAMESVHAAPPAITAGAVLAGNAVTFSGGR